MGGLHRDDRRLGLLEFRLQIGLIQADQHVPLVHLLAGLEINLDDPSQQFRADGRLVYGTNRSHRRLG